MRRPNARRPLEFKWLVRRVRRLRPPERDSLRQGNLGIKLEPVKLESAGFKHHWTVVSDDPRGAFALMDQSNMDFLLA